MPTSKNETKKSVDENGFLNEVLTKVKASRGVKTPYNQAVTTILEYYGAHVPKTKSSSEHAEFLLKTHIELAASVLNEIQTAWSKAKKNKDYSEINSYEKILGLLKKSDQIKIQRTRYLGLLSGFNSSKNKTVPDQNNNLEVINDLIKDLNAKKKELSREYDAAQNAKQRAELEALRIERERVIKEQAGRERKILLEIEKLIPKNVEDIDKLEHSATLEKLEKLKININLDTVKELMRNPNIIECLKTDPPTMPWELNEQYTDISAFRINEQQREMYYTDDEYPIERYNTYTVTKIPLLDELKNGFGALFTLALHKQPLPSHDILHTKSVAWEQELLRKDKHELKLIVTGESAALSQEALQYLLKNPPILPWELDSRNSEALKYYGSYTEHIDDGSEYGRKERVHFYNLKLDSLRREYPNLIAAAEANAARTRLKP